jgi:hypothetical protein
MLEPSNEFKGNNSSDIDLIKDFNKLSQMRFLGWFCEVKFMAI